MPPPPPCAWPDVAGSTGYARGCRCERCREAAFQIRRRHALRKAEGRREAEAQRLAEEAALGWYREHRDALVAAEQATGHQHTSDEHYNALRRDLAPGFVSGPFSAAEDRVIIAWRDTDLMLAVALGRTYWAVVGRKHRLRKQGRLWD
ncbi:MAG: hypothetical protein LCH76_13795 [Actinobacteria bacterium]|nr:hypothetical protein [Actinomycetota bacterium]